MSYEGALIFLCCNGHRRVFDCYESPGQKENCSCGASYCWMYDIDQTNDNGVHPALVQHQPAEYKECPYCKNKELVKEKTFCIPSNAGEVFAKPNVPSAVIKFLVSDYKDGKLVDTEYDTEQEAWDNLWR